MANVRKHAAQAGKIWKSLFIFVIETRVLSKATLPFRTDLRVCNKLFHGALWVTLALAGCTNPTSEVDISSTPLPPSVTFLRWNETLHDLERIETLEDKLDALMHADSAFWTTWCEGILRLGPAEDTASVAMLGDFERTMQPMLEGIDSTSGSPESLQNAERRMALAMRRMHVLMPDLALPRVVWMPSGFNFAVYPEADWLGVALEWFMGNEHPLLETLPPEKFPAYRLNRMRQEWMVSDAFRGWFAVQHQGAMGTDRRTVDLMLFWGKVLHVTARCLPETSPAGLMNWTSEEWAWAMAQERSIWRELQPQDVLFNRNPREVMRWFQEGPFTRAGAIPQDSPDRLGMFVGWRMVESFVRANPGMSTADLMAQTNPDPFLRGYRP